jgi:hypothetical protein
MCGRFRLESWIDDGVSLVKKENKSNLKLTVLTLKTDVVTTCTRKRNKHSYNHKDKFTYPGA